METGKILNLDRSFEPQRKILGIEEGIKDK